MSTAAEGTPRSRRPVSSLRRRAVVARLPDLLFVAALVLHALPPLALARFPTQDGPLHMENVVALLSRGEVDVYRSFLVANWGLQPNWLTQLLYAALCHAMSPLWAQRLVLAGAVVLLPLSVRFALPRTRRGRWAALAIFPFLYSFPFHMGFWNFSYGLGLLFLVIGVWRRGRGTLTFARGAFLSVLLVVTFFCHTVAVSASLATIAVMIGWRTFLDVRRAGTDRALRVRAIRAQVRHALALAVAAAPALALLGRFLLRHADHHTVRLSPLTLAGKLISLYTLVSLDRREVLLSLPIALAMIAAIVLRFVRPRWAGGAILHRSDGWIVAAAGFAVLYFVTPDVAASGAQISDRLALLPFLISILWLGTGAGPVGDVRRVSVVVLLLALAGLAFRIPRWRAIDRDLAEYASIAEAVAPGSVVVPVTYQPYGIAHDGARLAWRVRMFQHAAGYVAVERHALDLDNAQLNTDYGPVRLARGPRPADVLGPGDDLEGDPPCVDLDAWRVAGQRLDQVLLFGARTMPVGDACAERLQAILGRDYELAATSRPRGLVQVYRARVGGAAPDTTAAR